jgi:hypothetical protein
MGKNFLKIQITNITFALINVSKFSWETQLQKVKFPFSWPISSADKDHSNKYICLESVSLWVPTLAAAGGHCRFSQFFRPHFLQERTRRCYDFLRGTRHAVVLQNVREIHFLWRVGQPVAHDAIIDLLFPGRHVSLEAKGHADKLRKHVWEWRDKSYGNCGFNFSQLLV